MKTPRWVLALVLLALPACDAVVGDTSDERGALEVEVNEALTVSHLKSIQGAQLQFQALGLVDEDADGAGEFGLLAEMSGATGLRGSGAKIRFPLLPSDFRHLSGAGFAEVHGYVYRVFLPGAAGEPLGDGARTTGDVDADAAERTWTLYAWPSRYGVTGRRTFYVSAEGSLYETDRPEFSGASGPGPFAALAGTGDLRGKTGSAWTPVD